MATLGEALYDAITKGRSPRTEPNTFGAALATVITAAGSVAGAARALGLSRRTFRDWQAKGYAGDKTPTGGKRDSELIKAALRIERRNRLPRGREKRMRAVSPFSITLTNCTYQYRARDGKVEDTRDEVDVGQYLSASVLDDVLDAFLDGASLDELGDTFAAGIDDPADFYSETFSSGDEFGWDVGGVNW